MSQRDKMLREILSDPELRKKHNISDRLLNEVSCGKGPFDKKVIEVLAKIIVENDNKRSSRQIYTAIKNLHKI